ncbi:MAG: c-type cytochrome biogenesis protein CcmI [Gammaproteobacteria bacterium]|jgi:cytochrome c-type biogenesis protein CcmH
MSVFWLLAVSMVVIALLFIMPPLLRKPRVVGAESNAVNIRVIKDQIVELQADLASGKLDEAAFAEARRDLERELLNDIDGPAVQATAPVEAGKGRWLGLVLVLLVPAMAIVIYQQIGAEGAIERIEAAQSGVRTASPVRQRHSIEEMVAKLAQRMQQDPGNLEGWMLLGRSYASMHRLDDAADAYRHAMQIAPDNPDVLSSYADVLVGVNDGRFTDQVEQMLDRAVAANPQHIKSRWLRGHGKFSRADYSGAVDDWLIAMAGLPAGDENRAIIEGQIREARRRLGQPMDDIVATGGTDAGTPAAGGSSASVQLEVSLDPALKDKAAPGDTVFIFARAAQGPPMPLAVVRKRVADLPVKVTLDDSQAMSPAMTLSKFGQVTVGARISKSGQAMPSSGDLQGTLSPVSTGGDAVNKVVINELVGAGGPVAANTTTAPAAGGSSGSVQVEVSLDPALKDKAAPGDTVFIFARAVQGPPMPLAVVRKRVADLPVTVTLDDSQAMSPAMTLSKFGQVTVGARISKSGQAMPSSGDLQGALSPVSTSGDAVNKVTISEVVP